MRTSPSSASLISTPGVGWPTVPILIRSGGLQAPAPQVSDMPHSSPTGMPIAWKNSSTSSGVGAAPTLTRDAWSRPSIARSLENISSSALAHGRGQLVGDLLAGCSSRTFSMRVVERRLGRVALSSGSAASIVSRPALSFSQMRGTAKNQLGRTSGRYAERPCAGRGSR